MLNARYFLFFMILLLPLASCEKIIDVDLNSAEPKYVIEGIVPDKDLPITVKITMTKDFDEDNNFPGVENAVVKISDSNGGTVTLDYTDSGVYMTTEMQGAYGVTYTLSVDIAGTHFASESTMPFPVSVDSIYLRLKKAPFTGDTIYTTVLEYQDPPEVDNYFRYKMWINSMKRKQIYVDSDKYNNGKYVKVGFEYYADDDDKDSPKLNDGDVITMEMHCVDENVHQYFSELEWIISGMSSSLANPTSNITGGALGYFSAQTNWSGSIVVKKE